MKTLSIHLGAVCLMLLALPLHAAVTHYVDLNCTNPVSPYTNWATAATNIQDAIDAAANGDLVLVTNGVYATGGRVVYGSLTNRVVIDKAVTVQSVSGPTVTIIQGYQVPGTTNGDSAVRCAYLTNGATLIGFTLTNGATRSSGSWPQEQTGGGAYCESTNAIISNCVLMGNSAGDSGGGASGGSLSNCMLKDNSVPNSGGGAFYSAMNDCVLAGNFAGWGGGGAAGWDYHYPWLTLNNCTLTNNSSVSSGGGAYELFLNHCFVADNFCTDSGSDGGGVDYCAIQNSLLTDNLADWGGGAESSDLYNCILTNNYAGSDGGGGDSCYFVNCTIVNNSAGQTAGGESYSGIYNCIVYYNTAPSQSNWYGNEIDHCCTMPLPATGTGNFTNNPTLVNLANGDLHLQSNSPCINAGLNSYLANNPDSFIITTDLDGRPRIVGGTVDIGAYEYQTPSSILSYAWAQQYGLPTDGSADTVDTDGDGMNNYSEWKAGTDPTNSLSLLQLNSPVSTNSADGVIATWQSVNGITYYLQRSTNLTAAFSTIQSNLVGQAGTTSFTDTTATNGGPYFYRVGVQ